MAIHRWAVRAPRTSSFWRCGARLQERGMSRRRAAGDIPAWGKPESSSNKLTVYAVHDGYEDHRGGVLGVTNNHGLCELTVNT